MSDSHQARRHRQSSIVNCQSDDRLPPHSLEAEAGVLGCIFLAAHESLPAARKAFGVTQPFYDVRHALIYQVLGYMFDAPEPIDEITFGQRLKDLNNDRECGGLSYWSQLSNQVPSAANLPRYLDIVREKFAARLAIQTAQRIVDKIMECEGTAEPVITQAAEEFTRLTASLHVPGADVMPPHVKQVEEFHDKVWNCFFGKDAAEPGVEMPFGFPMKKRGGELTFLIGESGAGKSTLQNWIGLHMAHAGDKLFVASMEVKPEITLKMFVQQLLGQREFQQCRQHETLVRDAIAWLNGRIVIYDFLGIADWRELLDSMNYASQFLGCNVFMVDSVMRLGVADDDYAEQGACAKSLANFCVGRDTHLFLVNHLNKGDGGAKQRSRGSAQWTDNAHNIISIKAHPDKGEKMSDLWKNKETDENCKTFTEEKRAKFDAELLKLKALWDTHLILHKQRWPGSRQNGSTYLWFDYHTLQFRDRLDKPKRLNLLEEWKPKHRSMESQLTEGAP